MTTLRRTALIAILASLAVSCVTYSSASKAHDGQVWLSGATNYFVISVPFIRRCDVVDGNVLKCEEMNEEAPPPASRRHSTEAEPPASDSGDAGAKKPASK